MIAPDDEPRYCEDCRHCIPERAYYRLQWLPWPPRLVPSMKSMEHAKCGKGSVLARGFGEHYCSVLRTLDQKCGPSARWFEKKEAK